VACIKSLSITERKVLNLPNEEKGVNTPTKKENHSFKSAYTHFVIKTNRQGYLPL
jgi:hypothetical protein